MNIQITPTIYPNIHIISVTYNPASDSIGTYNLGIWEIDF